MTRTTTTGFAAPAIILQKIAKMPNVYGHWASAKGELQTYLLVKGLP